MTAPAAPATALPHGGSTSTLDCPAIVVLVEPRNQSVGMNWRGSGCGRVWDVCVDGSLRMLSHDLYKPTSQAPVQVSGSVQNMGEGGRWAAMSVAIAGDMAARMTKPKSAEVQGPEVPVPRFLAGRRTCSLRPCATPLRRCCATHARASISSGQQE
jgi:hypothetical protein